MSRVHANSGTSQLFCHEKNLYSDNFMNHCYSCGYDAIIEGKAIDAEHFRGCSVKQSGSTTASISED